MKDMYAPPILQYKDVLKRAPGKAQEDLVDAKLYDETIVTQYDKFDMEAYIGDVVLVRKTLARKLASVNAALKDGQRLKVVYGYRHPAIQEKYFKLQTKMAKEAMPNLSNEGLIDYVHNFVAVPEVAGHPTGGAVDLTIIDSNGQELDMGTRIADFSAPDKIKTFSKELTHSQISNRKLLHDLMLKQGFAPFYGEWWHFSYGDREWAAFYDKPQALYGTIEITAR